jgi:TRAP-type C4-dicarboxylate transport system permease small subunit
MKKSIHAVSAVLAVLSAVSVAVLMFLVTIDVLRRSLFGRSVPGAVEIGELMVVAIVFLGIGYAQQRKDHVAINAFTARLPLRVATVLRLVGQVLLCVLVVWMIYASGRAAWQSFLTGEYRFGLLRVPIWPARAVIPLGLTSLLLEVAADLHTVLRVLLEQPGPQRTPINPEQEGARP